MKQSFGLAPDGREATLYTISSSHMKVQITDFGATLVRLYHTIANGDTADVVLGFDCAADYAASTTYFGATVGRTANRIARGSFVIGDTKVQMNCNDGNNNLHAGPDGYSYRLWQLTEHTQDKLVLQLDSPHGDQGLPGNATVRVTFLAESPATLRISYDAVSDRDTVFNLTNHAYFNMAGHEHPELAMDQLLMMPARHFTPADSESIPTGELRSVEGTAMDFRIPKPLGQDLHSGYECLVTQGGYDHNFEVFGQPCAVLTDPHSGRSLAITTDLPGIQLYSGNYLEGEMGKDGVSYIKNGGVALETQYYPNCVNEPAWKQPFFRAGEHFRSQSVYCFK